MSALAKPADEPEDTATPIEAAIAEEAADDDLTESPAAASRTPWNTSTRRRRPRCPSRRRRGPRRSPSKDNARR